MSDVCEPGEFEPLVALVPAGGLDLSAIQRLTAQQGSATARARDAMDDEVPPAERERAAAAFRYSLMLLMLAQATDGWSGRSLRRLPLLAHAEAGGEGSLAYAPFLLAMHSAVLDRDADAANFEQRPPSCAGAQLPANARAERG